MKGIVLLSALMFTGIAVAEEGDSNAFDMYELGKRVYTMGSDSCLSCHGADGAGTDR